MSRAAVSLESVVAGLRADGRLDEAQAAEAEALTGKLRDVQPWYVRAMVSFGAWLASLWLIGFVAGLGILVGGFVVVGLALIAGAVTLRRQLDNDFVVQATLAASIAGQALLAWGIADSGPGESMELLCGVIIAVSGVLFFIFPDRIHRVLSVLFAASALVVLLYVIEWNAAVPLLGPALAAALVTVHRKRAALTAAGQGHLLRPLESGLMLSAFGCLLLSTVYLLPALGSEFVFYPRPWISTVLLGALLLYVGSFTLRPLLEGSTAVPVTYGLMLAVIACAWAAPGILLALIVILLGAAAGERTSARAGIAFLSVFVTAYFYGMETTMLAKSITLCATGAAILGARYLLLRLAGARPTGDSHA
ncbi:MAG TPA: DUF4401 domain-containing protein [Woeseiaceae bacterium]|nr:DUF4401 domain-containing protein [Woeseiaceae bacterium]